MQSIQAQFELHKAKIFSIYHRRLQEQPELGGKVEFFIHIEKEGDVSNCRAQTEKVEINSVANEICKYIMTMSFGKGEAFELPYLIKFFPAS